MQGAGRRLNQHWLTCKIDPVCWKLIIVNLVAISCEYKEVMYMTCFLQQPKKLYHLWMLSYSKNMYDQKASYNVFLNIITLWFYLHNRIIDIFINTDPLFIQYTYLYTILKLTFLFSTIAPNLLTSITSWTDMHYSTHKYLTTLKITISCKLNLYYCCH